MVSKRFIVTCAAVALVTLVGQDDNDHSNEKFVLVMVCTVIIAAMATNALVDRLFSLLSSSYSASEFETTGDNDDDEPDDDDETPSSHNIKYWTKPEFGWVKLNVDGSHNNQSNPRSSGCGGVLRDLSGTWLLGFSQKLDPSFNDDRSELEAILKGLELAWHMNYKKLVVESDRDSAVSRVNKAVKNNRPQSDVISSIKELLSYPEWEVKVVHVSGKANEVADRLAKAARDLPSWHPRKYPPHTLPAYIAILVEKDNQVRV